MIHRYVTPTPNRSFFLFGARGTGKSTFLRQHFAEQDVLWLDLLLPEVEDRYASRPHLLSEQITARPDPAGWVVIDEVQKVPRLLDAGCQRYPRGISHPFGVPSPQIE